MKFLYFLPLLVLPYTLKSQQTDTTNRSLEVERESIYKINHKIDWPIAILGIAGTAYGFHLREAKSNSDSATIVNLNVNDLAKFNRHVTTQDNFVASKVSDVLLAGGFVFPWFLAFDKEIRKDIGSVSLLYLQTMAITGTGYWLTAGSVDKYRPYVYNKNVDLKRRMSKHSKNSFYGGHPSVTAAGTFFMAQVYNDYHPDSKFRYVMWSFAGVATLTNVYCRYRGGFHFPTDLAIGVAVGAATGVLVPILHRRKSANTGVTIAPTFIENTPGLYFKYAFK